MAAVLALAYGLAASPWGVETITRPGRFVIQALRFLGSGLLRVIAAANARARPWFAPADRADTERKTAGAEDAVDDTPAEEEAEEAPAWGQQPLIRVADRMPAAAAPPQQEGRWQLPGMELLLPAEDSGEVPEDEIVSKAASIEETLESFKVKVRVAEAVPGPVVTQYLLEPGPGVKVARITALANDLASQAGRSQCAHRGTGARTAVRGAGDAQRQPGGGHAARGHGEPDLGRVRFRYQSRAWPGRRRQRARRRPSPRCRMC